MKISVSDLYNSKIFLILTMLAFYKPGIFNYLSQFKMVNLVYNILQIAIVIIILIFSFISKKKSKIIMNISVFYCALLICTIINNGKTFSVLKTLLYLWTFVLFVDQAMQKNAKLFIKVGHGVLGVLALINLISVVACPNGLFVTEYYHNKFYFMNTKNGFIGFILPFVILGLLNYNIEKNVKNMCCLIFDFFIAFFTMVLGDSSTGLLTFIILMIQILFICNKKAFAKIAKIFIYLLIIFTIGIVFFRIQYYFSNIIEGIFHKSADLSMRTEIWDVAIKMIKKRPIIGFGWDINNGNILIGSTYYYSHNMLLEIMVSGGILALMAFFGIYMKIFNKIKNSKITSNGIWYVLMGLICYTILAITEAPLASYGFYMLFVIAYSDYFYKEEGGEKSFYEKNIIDKSR